jgi:hypothetical protein
MEVVDPWSFGKQRDDFRLPSLRIAVPGFFEALFGGGPKAGRLPGFVALLGSDGDPDDQVSVR